MATQAIETTIARQLGDALPFTGVTLPPGFATRAALRTWLIRCGKAAGHDVRKVAMSAVMDTLAGAYANPARLAEIIGATVLEADAIGRAQATNEYTPRRPSNAGTVANDDNDDNDDDAQNVIPLPIPTPAPVAPTNAGTVLENIIRDIAGGAVNEARVLELIRQHAPKSPNNVVEIRVNDAPAVLIDTAHAKLAETLKWIVSGAHVALIGPAGSGKTELAVQVAKALNRPFYLTGALSSEYKLLGFMDAQGRFVSTNFRKAVEHGGVFLLDECDASAPGVLLTINAALANGHMDFQDGTVAVHPDFICMIAANTYGRGADRQYVGRNQLDAATLDRFAFLPVDYDEALEARLCGDPAWHKRVVSLRRAVRETKTRLVVSMRASIRGARALAAGLSQAEVEEALIWKGVDDDTRAKVQGAAR